MASQIPAFAQLSNKRLSLLKVPVGSPVSFPKRSNQTWRLVAPSSPCRINTKSKHHICRPRAQVAQLRDECLSLSRSLLPTEPNEVAWTAPCIGVGFFKYSSIEHVLIGTPSEDGLFITKPLGGEQSDLASAVTFLPSCAPRLLFHLVH